MKFKFKRNFLFVLSLLIVLMISACGNKDKPSVSGASTDNGPTQDDTIAEAAEEDDVNPADDPILSQIALPTSGDLILPAIEELSGIVVFSRGNDIYQGQFNGEAATLVVGDSSATTINIVPDAQAIIHKSSGVRRPKIQLTSLATLETVDLLPLSGQFRQISGHARGWSPNGKWLVALDIFTGDWSVLNNEGTLKIALDPTITPVWLEDNTLLQIISDLSLVQAFQSFDAPQVIGLAKFDPETEIATPLNIATDTMRYAGDFSTLDVLVSQLGLSLAKNPSANVIGDTVYISDELGRYNIISPTSHWQFQPSICDTWMIEQTLDGAEPTTIATFENTFWISDINALSNGTVLFMKWTIDNCDINGTMRVSLMRLVPDGTIQEVVDGLTPVEDGRNNLNAFIFSKAHHYDVSPNEDYVLWAGGGLDTRTATLNLTNIETGATVPLVDASGGSGGDDYLDNRRIMAVFWLKP